MNHYTYCLLGSDGRFYYGSRSCDCDPRKDPYLGSCKDKTFVPVRKRVLKRFGLLDLAIIEEMRIHVTKDVGPNPRYANGATLRPRGMSRKGVLVTEATRHRMSESGKKRRHSPETKEKIAESLRKTPKKVGRPRVHKDNQKLL